MFWTHLTRGWVVSLNNVGRAEAIVDKKFLTTYIVKLLISLFLSLFSTVLEIKTLFFSPFKVAFFGLGGTFKHHRLLIMPRHLKFWIGQE